jgi:hypothetical protein
MTNLSRALDVAEDKDKAFFDFNKLAEALNVAEEKKGKKTGKATSKEAAIEGLFLGVTMFFSLKN